jgi:chromosome partitioning protein
VSIIAVVNRKGGSGKSMLAVHLAACLARDGHGALLADLDRNRSASSWLRARHAQRAQALPPIQGYALEPGRALRRPPGVSHTVIDTPSGLQGFDLARVACYADAILMPIGGGRFDLEAASATHAELLTAPRVASGRCKLAAVGMRVSPRNNTAARIKRWSAEHGVPLLTLLRDSPLVASCVERGHAIFDLPPGPVAADLAAWTPLLNWLEPLIQAPSRAATRPGAAFTAAAPVLKKAAFLGPAAPAGTQSRKPGFPQGSQPSAGTACGSPWRVS